MRRDGVRRLPIVPQQRSYRDLPIETEVTERVMPLRKVCPSEMLYDGMRRPSIVRLLISDSPVLCRAESASLSFVCRAYRIYWAYKSTRDELRATGLLG